MNGGLRFRQPAEQAGRARPRRGRQRRPIDVALDIFETMMAAVGIVRMALMPVLVSMSAVIAPASADVIHARMNRRRLPLVKCRFDEREFCRRHTRAQDPLALDRSVIDRQAPECFPQGFERQPEIEAGAEEHISRDPREAVDVERLAHDEGVPFSR